jgi:hypothetical protein
MFAIRTQQAMTCKSLTEGEKPPIKVKLCEVMFKMSSQKYLIIITMKNNMSSLEPTINERRWQDHN